MKRTEKRDFLVKKRQAAVRCGSHTPREGSISFMLTITSSTCPDLSTGIHRFSTNTSLEQFCGWRRKKRERRMRRKRRRKIKRRRKSKRRKRRMKIKRSRKRKRRKRRMKIKRRRKSKRRKRRMRRKRKKRIEQ